MKIEILMSTCGKNKIKDLHLKEKNIKNAVIVNQFKSKEEIEQLKNAVMYSYNEKGIAKSRNRLLEKSSGDIEIITDDDISFVEDYEKIVKEAYEKNDADIIIFNLKKGNEVLGSDKRFFYNKLSIMHVCSCQITFRRKSIIDNHIKFDEQFGIGSSYVSGEENIFLKEAIDKGLKILHIPIVINEHPEENTTGENLNEKVIVSKGAFSYRAYKKIYYVLLFYFAFFKYKEYKTHYSVFSFIKLFNQGKKQFIQTSKTR